MRITILFSILLIMIADISLIAEENRNVESLDGNILIRPYVAIPSTRFILSHYENNKYTPEGITYKPNNFLDFGFHASYKMFGLSIGTASIGKTLTTKDKDTHGDSKAKNIQFSYYARKCSFDLYYQKYSGFYNATPKYSGLSNSSPESRRSDISIYNASANIFYIFADNFSLAASMNNNERQTSSHGSFLLMLSTGYFYIDASQSLIPEKNAAEFHDDAGLTQGRFSSIGLSPGYAYSLIIDKFYITPSFFLGTGIMNKKTVSTTGHHRKTETFNKMNARFAAGYNGDTFVSGVYASNDTTSTRTWFFGKGTKISFQIIKVEAFAGMRL